jgi:hypothetical protein
VVNGKQLPVELCVLIAALTKPLIADTDDNPSTVRLAVHAGVVGPADRVEEE